MTIRADTTFDDLPLTCVSAERDDGIAWVTLRAGFHVERVIGTASPFSVIECLPL